MPRISVILFVQLLSDDFIYTLYFMQKFLK